MPFQSRRHWGLGVGGGGSTLAPKYFLKQNFFFYVKPENKKFLLVINM